MTGISELIDFDNNKKQVYSSEVHMTGADYGITPAILKEYPLIIIILQLIISDSFNYRYYGIPSSINGSKVTSQGIAAFNDFFSLGALAVRLYLSFSSFSFILFSFFLLLLK